MKPTKTKAEIRRELESQVDAFLREGGNVSTLAQGVSGREIGQALPPVSFDKKPEVSRTPVNDVVQAIEERKHPPRSAKPITRRRQKKVLLCDDFGEPIRWVWSED